LGWPWLLYIHNQITRPSLGLHIASIDDTLYYITNHLEESTKNRKWCISICPIHTSRPYFK
jgi:hypothetical protein